MLNHRNKELTLLHRELEILTIKTEGVDRERSDHKEENGNNLSHRANLDCDAYRRLIEPNKMIGVF